MNNTGEQTATFDDIRSIRDDEVPATIESLLGDDNFANAIRPVVGVGEWHVLSETMRKCKTVRDFQQKVICPTMARLIGRTTTDLVGLDWENIETEKSHVFISNHRDIVLDAAFLNILMFLKDRDTSEIAIGDNLLVYPWITKLVRLNKSFIVKRGVSVRQMLDVSKHLSEYIHDTVTGRNQSVWIAQREGRAKDSNDKTQISLLKMLSLTDPARPLEALKHLNIVPLSVSYEYDPCDYLKAKEFQLKRDDARHKKTQADDVENMVAGILGFKGRCRFHFGKPVNERLDTIDPGIGKSEALEKAAAAIDAEIYGNYEFFPFNYIAYDEMNGAGAFEPHYSAEEKRNFDDYLEKQIDKISLKDKDRQFLRLKIVEMYGNTVKNYLSVQP